MAPRLAQACILLAANLAVVSGLACARPSEPVRIAISPWPGYELLQLAQDEGFFAEEGADVRLVELRSLVDARRAYERDQVDGLAGTLLELILLRAHTDRPPVAVLVPSYGRGADVVLARPQIEDVSGLRGRRVGLDPATVNLLVLDRALDLAGLALEDVVRVAVDPLRMSRALARDDVDAVVAYPPVSHQIERDHDVRRLFRATDMEEELIDVVMLAPSVIEERPEEIDALVRGFARAVRFLEEQPDRALSLMAVHERMDPALLASAMEQDVAVVPLSRQRRYLSRDGIVPRALPAVERLLREAGHLHRSQVPLEEAASDRFVTGDDRG